MRTAVTKTGTDGANPDAGLVLSGTTLYGTTDTDGANGLGTVFALKIPEPSSLTLAALALGFFVLKLLRCLARQR